MQSSNAVYSLAGSVIQRQTALLQGGLFCRLIRLNLLKLQTSGNKYVNNPQINLYFLPKSNNELIDFTYISMVKFCLKYV